MLENPFDTISSNSDYRIQVLEPVSWQITITGTRGGKQTYNKSTPTHGLIPSVPSRNAMAEAWEAEFVAFMKNYTKFLDPDVTISFSSEVSFAEILGPK